MSRLALAIIAAAAVAMNVSPQCLSSLATAIVVANIRWPSTTSRTGAVAAWRRRSGDVASFGYLEARRARDGVRLRQPKCQPLAKAIGLTGFIASQSAR